MRSDPTSSGGRQWPGRPVLRALNLIVLMVASGCALLPQPDIQAPGVQPPPAHPAQVPEPSIRYEITSAALEIHTYRAGWLARLAHNHVIETDAVEGVVHLSEPIGQSSARLYFRPWDLVLDDPASRAEAGPGFESERTAQEIDATRRRMLGPKGFHSNVYPWVTVDVGWRDADVVTLTIQVRDGSHRLDVPISWSLQGDQLEALADFKVRQRDFGIRPYSAFAGAIAVADRIRIQLTLSAGPASSL